MNRRSFIGGVIGILVSSKIPFVAEEARYSIDKSPETRVRRIAKTLLLPESELKKFRIFAKAEGNPSFWISPLEKITRTEKDHLIEVHFKAESIRVEDTFLITRAGLCDSKNRLIREYPFKYPIHMTPSDLLNITVSLSIG